MADTSSMHSGHRQRLKERFLTEGLDHFSDINALELLLFYCIPRRDTNPVAHRLLDRFGKFHHVLDAPYSELIKVEGVSENTATFLALFRQMNRYYEKSQAEDIRIVDTTTKCGNYLAPYFRDLWDETVYLLCLDAKCKVLCCKKVGEGSLNSVAFSTRKIVEIAIAAGASSVVLAHNHPSGLAIPSPEDTQTTKRLGQALDMVDIVLADHIIVSGEDYTSLMQSGLYDPREYSRRI